MAVTEQSAWDVVIDGTDDVRCQFREEHIFNLFHSLGLKPDMLWPPTPQEFDGIEVVPGPEPVHAVFKLRLKEDAKKGTVAVDGKAIGEIRRQTFTWAAEMGGFETPEAAAQALVTLYQMIHEPGDEPDNDEEYFDV